MRKVLNSFGQRAVPAGAGALLVAAAIVLAGPQAAARSKIASCRIVSGGKVAFSGRCRFTAERDGSFFLEPARGRGRLFGAILSVSVTIVGRGVAEVRGLTSAGVSSHWGRVVRSKRDRACWVGTDIRVCAR